MEDSSGGAKEGVKKVEKKVSLPNSAAQAQRAAHSRSLGQVPSGNGVFVVFL